MSWFASLLFILFCSNMVLEVSNQSDYDQEKFGSPIETIESYELKVANFDLFNINILDLIFVLLGLVPVILNLIVLIVRLRGTTDSPVIEGFLIHLSIADFLHGLSMPFTFFDFLKGYWGFPFPMITCRLVNLLQATSNFATFWIHCVVSIHCALGIVCPLRIRLNYTDRNNRFLQAIKLAWAVGLVFGGFQAYISTVTRVSVDNITRYDCKESWTLQQSRIYTFVVLIVYCVLPGGVLISALIMAMVSIGCHRAPHNNRTGSISLSKVNQTLLTILILFVALIMPWHAFSFINYYDAIRPILDEYPEFFTGVVIVLTAFTLLHSIIDPIVYSFMRGAFQVGLKTTFKAIWNPVRIRFSQWLNLATNRSQPMELQPRQMVFSLTPLTQEESV